MPTLFALVLAFVALTAGCGAASAPVAARPAGSAASTGIRLPASPDPGPVRLTETGSTLLYPLLGSWAAAYGQQFPQVSLTTAATGSGVGISAAAAGTVDIGASDAYLSAGDLVQNPTLLNIPLAISAQQVNYNLPTLPADVHLQLTGTVLAQMYSGAITTWNNPAIAALNPGVRLPATRVVPVRRSDSSGDTFLFTSYLASGDPAWNTDIGHGTMVGWPHVAGERTEHGNAGMVSGCKLTPGCVAYIGISYLTQALGGGLGEAKLVNALGRFELPTRTTMAAAAAAYSSLLPPNETISMISGPAAGGYPIVNYEYAIVRKHQATPRDARDLQAFLHWAITTGNQDSFLATVRFQPLPGPTVQLADAQIAEIK
ncbi:MAG TPA: phosphate ABC transporter substrate-binding protein PstS [Streptosporangiaceae bacterium]